MFARSRVTIFASDPQLVGRRTEPRKRKGARFVDACWNCGQFHPRSMPCHTLFATRQPHPALQVCTVPTEGQELTTSQVYERLARQVKAMHPHQLARVAHVDEVDLRRKTVVYIGRRNTKRNLPQSKWHNPYPLPQGKTWDPAERRECIRKFISYLLAPEQAELRAQLPELQGKTLACHCRDHTHPNALCHGLILLALAEEGIEWF